VSVGQSCLYFGQVIHRRFAPKAHRLRYGLFQTLFDLDDIQHLNDTLTLFSYNRFNIVSFYDRDHCGIDSTPRAHVENILAGKGIKFDQGKIMLLCMPRLIGFAFNPLSIYFCFHDNGELIATIYHVNNTFGERHDYVVPVRPPPGRIIQQTCRKVLFVSPFMDMDMSYTFKLLLPADDIATIVQGHDRSGRMLIFTAFSGRRRAFSDRNLLSAIGAYPFMTIGVVFAIHWEAVKLFAKGLRLRSRPAPPAEASMGRELSV